MNIKILLFFILATGMVNGVFCQNVDLRKGSFETSIPIYSGKDPLSKLSLSLSLNYSSGNGVVVDEIPSCIGQGWNLNGLGVITRIQRGTAPDDQKELSGPIKDIYKYPPGYIFNPRAITDGCPKQLTTYPIFAPEIIMNNGFPVENKFIVYNDDNAVTADREQDYFVFSFNGSTGKFVIDKNKEVHLLNDSRIKINITSWDIEPANGCRTLINKFTITDENGIEYEFGVRDYVKNFDYHTPNFYSKVINAYDIPNTYNPYITNNWYLSKIFDPLTGREISFQYKTDIINMLSGHSIQLICTTEHETNMEGNVINVPGVVSGMPPIPLGKTVVTETRLFTKKPEIKEIKMPNNEIIDFIYPVPRKDCSGSSTLSKISVTYTLDNHIENYELQQSYFVKNAVKQPSIGEEKFSRLVLQAINKVVNNEIQNLSSFEYYLGTDNSENFVPPIFFHAKDPWGYYNGNYCGVPVNDFLTSSNIFTTSQICFSPEHCYTMTWGDILANFNSDFIVNGFYPGSGNPSNEYIRSNVKSLYAQNGLLKSITNLYGGKTSITYKQNLYENSDPDWQPASQPDFGSSHRSIEPYVVGGVHASFITDIDEEGRVGKATEYKFVKENGVTSSLWGIELPANINIGYNDYLAEDRYFNVPCDYTYKYPGVKHAINFESKGNFGEESLNALKTTTNLALNFMQLMISPQQYYMGLIQGLIFNTLPNLLWSCLGDDIPFQKTTTCIHVNRALNFSNSLPIQFNRVEVYSYAPQVLGYTPGSPWIQNGKTVFEFTSPSDPGLELVVPYNYHPYTNQPRAYDWEYGLIKSMKVYNVDGKIVKSNEYKYHSTITGLGEGGSSCNCIPGFFKSQRSDQWSLPININDFSNTTITGEHNNNGKSPALKVEFYSQSSGRMELTQKTDRLFDKNGEGGNAIESTTDYEYNALNYQVSAIKTTNSEGKSIIKQIYYPEDYNLLNPNNAILKSLVDANIVNVPVITETKQKTETNEYRVLEYTANKFGVAPNNDIKPQTVYSLYANMPIEENLIGEFNPDYFGSTFSQVKEVSTITYDENGNPVEVKNVQEDKKSVSVFGYDNQYCIGSVSNAQKDEVVYTSFENSETGNWTILGTIMADNTSPTGKMCLSGHFKFTSPILSVAKDYRLTFWTTATNIHPLSATLVTSGPTINGWTYYEYLIPAGFTMPVQFDGDGKIDEVRLYPKNALMKTVTYNPSIGKSSECDENNHIKYYEYDNWGHLRIVRDEKRDIIKTYEYHYKTD